MEVKKDIKWRVYISYLAVVFIGMMILAKAFYIQQVKGDVWLSKSDSLHTHVETLVADRGTIYSSNGEMLSTSVPQFDIYIDFAADGLVELQRKYPDSLNILIDSLSYQLSHLFGDRTKSQYKAVFTKGLQKGSRYYALKKKVSFDQFQSMKSFSLIRLGKNKSGFIKDVHQIRLNPYDLLAYRTIGLDRKNAQKVGLEQTYDSVLSGKDGQRIVRYVSGIGAMPLEDEAQLAPQNGNDIVTTIDTRIQEIAENALLKMMQKNEAEQGCAVVMEVATGKIRAIANLGKTDNGSYWENFNYAMIPTEPGSTFKLATLLAVFEDKKFNINSTVNLNAGTWKINKDTVYDSEPHGMYSVTVKRAFEVSSNVGMAKLAYSSYANQPAAFIRHLHELHLDTLTGIDLYGERAPAVLWPKSPYWSATTLPWMAFGYNLTITPLHTAMLYNAVANNGKMLRPYLLESVRKEGAVIRSQKAVVIKDSICSSSTLAQLRACLEGVCSEPGGTAYKLFSGTSYKVAGKTGTALVANGNRGYTDKIYQSSFAGYFPADNPQYTCVVVIKNKQHAPVFYGALVAGPVFKEIADRLVTMNVKKAGSLLYTVQKKDSGSYYYAGKQTDIRYIMNRLQIPYKDSTNENDNWVTLKQSNKNTLMHSKNVNVRTMPQLRGLSAKDAVYLCEVLGLAVQMKGLGHVREQSIEAGDPIARGQMIKIQLGS
jgi:cell division protein FtsI (penicillin-binding protein 3)